MADFQGDYLCPSRWESEAVINLGEMLHEISSLSPASSLANRADNLVRRRIGCTDCVCRGRNQDSLQPHDDEPYRARVGERGR